MAIQIVLLDIHSLAERFYFSDSVLVRLKSCISLLKARLAALEDGHLVSSKQTCTCLRSGFAMRSFC